MNTSTRRAAFLDRDGTLNADYPDEEWATKTTPEILCGVTEGLRLIQRIGYDLVMVTNQYTIGEGIISEEAYGMFTAALLRRLQFVGVTFTAVLYCPHSRIVDCECRKPKPGLIQRFFTDNPDVDRERSVLIGDSSVDILAGSAAGIETIGVGSAALQGLGTYRCDTLIEAAKWLSVREYGS